MWCLPNRCNTSIGVRLAGYGNRTAPSNAIHDALCAQVLYFQDENQVEVVLISLDLIGVDRDFTAHVRSKFIRAHRYQ